MFHYTTLDGLIGILDSKKLWLVSSLEMNDKADRFYANLFATTALLISDDENALLLKEKLSPEDILNINMETMDIPFYSASFCEDCNNDSLWQIYADNNHGICIEFDETVFEEYQKQIVKEKYRMLEYEDATPQNIISKRKVLYGYPEKDFFKVLKSTKLCCVPEDEEENIEYKKSLFKNWFKLTLLLFAGMVKSETFSKEREIRWLFQNTYSEEYIRKNPFFEIPKYNFIEVLEKLGIDKEAPDMKKRLMQLNIESPLKQGLIKSIIIGDDFSKSIGEIKSKIKAAKLSNVVLRDRKGAVL